jgi:hypothetical protein
MHIATVAAIVNIQICNSRICATPQKLFSFIQSCKIAYTFGRNASRNLHNPGLDRLLSFGQRHQAKNTQPAWNT